MRGEFRPDGVEREWCDEEVLQLLRRRSLAVLRKEVEPVDGTALARFLPAVAGRRASSRRGLEGLVEVLGALQGAALPASVLESDVLPARMAAYRPGRPRRPVHRGRGGLGRRRRARARPTAGCASSSATDSALLVPAADEPPEGPVHAALLAHLDQRGASFWPDLVAASGEADAPYDETDRAHRALGPGLGRAGHQRLARPAPGVPRRPARAGRRSAGPSPGRLTRLGPPQAAGRWSLVDPLRRPVPTETEAAHARAQQLLERYGVLTREAALGEGAEGGFAGVYPVLKALEDRGQVRRGYFVAGLGGAQFALPGAVDRLRAGRDGDGRACCWPRPTPPSPTVPRCRGPRPPAAPAAAPGPTS